MSKNSLINGPVGSEALALTRSRGAEGELTIGDLWTLVGRRRVTIISVLLACVALGALVCVFSTRRYEATAELQLEKETASPLGLQGGGDGGGVSDALQDNVTLQTQASILQSDSLALNVIQKLNLEGNPDFRPQFNPVGWVLGFISPDGPADPKRATFENSPRRRVRALSVFHSNLKVAPVAGTRLITVSYLNPDPEVAVEVVNSISDGLVQYNFEIRHNATVKTAGWLSGQLTDLRRQSEELQAKVARAQRDTGVVSLGGVDSQGREQLYSSVLDKLQQATTTYAQAESSRIFKQAIYEVTKTGDPEAISGLTSNPLFTGAAGGMDGTIALIQSLHVELADTQSQLAQLAAKFGPAYPKVIEMQSKLNSTQKAIQTAVTRLAERAKNNYQVARQVEDSTRSIYVDQKHQAEALSDKAMAYTILRQEADQSRSLYEGLFGRMKQAGLLAEFHSNNISVVDPARVPAKPSRPRVLLYMLASIGGGLIFGFCGALVRDGTDRKIHSLAELEATLNQPPLGMIPHYKASQRQPVVGSAGALLSSGESTFRGPEGNRAVKKASSRRVPAFDDSSSSYVESLRALRTSLLLSRGGAPPKVILITSSVTGEGKSMLSVNLAALLAHQKKKVLLIDADMRWPTLHRWLGEKAEGGLSSFLAGQGDNHDATSAIIPPEIGPCLHFLPAGPIPPYPAELLASEQMSNGLNVWREHFDFIILDSPPVLPVTDSVILSTMADFTILLARHELTERQALERSYRTLQAQASSNRVGVVMNAVRNKDKMYYDYYGYKGGKYYEEAARS